MGFMKTNNALVFAMDKRPAGPCCFTFFNFLITMMA